MKIDGAIFSIEPRSVGSCLDLGIVFYRENFSKVFTQVLLFAVPSLVFTWILVSWWEFSTVMAAFLFFIESPFLGAVLVASAGPRLFGERLSVRKSLKRVWDRSFLLIALILIGRLAIFFLSFFMLIPGVFVAARYASLSEVILLEGTPSIKYESRLSDLTSHVMTQQLGRLIVLIVFFTIASISVFSLLDFCLGSILSWPLFVGRDMDPEYFFEETGYLLWWDPYVAVGLMAAMWIVYPITRFAWMFCYLDTRIRSEGWDTDLDFRIEAQRIKEAK